MQRVSGVGPDFYLLHRYPISRVSPPSPTLFTRVGSVWSLHLPNLGFEFTITFGEWSKINDFASRACMPKMIMVHLHSPRLFVIFGNAFSWARHMDAKNRNGMMRRLGGRGRIGLLSLQEWIFGDNIEIFHYRKTERRPHSFARVTLRYQTQIVVNLFRALWLQFRYRLVVWRKLSAQLHEKAIWDSFPPFSLR